MIPLQMLLTSIRDNYQIVGTIDCNSYNNNFADLYIALQELKQDSFHGVDIALFSAGGIIIFFNIVQMIIALIKK